MRSAIDKIILSFLFALLSLFSYNSISKDFGKFEKICKEIGFKPKTEAFGECVLELVEREPESTLASSSDPDTQTCLSYGFKFQTQAFAECKFKLDMAKQESARAQEKYDRERADYERQVAEAERVRERARGLRMMEYGTRLLGGQSPIDAALSIGTGRPIAPAAPDPITQTITTPGGRIIHCTTMGSMTNCH